MAGDLRVSHADTAWGFAPGIPKGKELAKIMVALDNPHRPRPQVETDSPVSMPEPRREDLGEAVPVGEPEDEGYVIKEEDRESPTVRRPAH